MLWGCGAVPRASECGMCCRSVSLVAQVWLRTAEGVFLGAVGHGGRGWLDHMEASLQSKAKLRPRAAHTLLQ